MPDPSPQALAELLAGAINEDAIDPDQPAAQGGVGDHVPGGRRPHQRPRVRRPLPDGREFHVTVRQYR
jgi:hypothetical protein